MRFKITLFVTICIIIFIASCVEQKTSNENLEENKFVVEEEYEYIDPIYDGEVVFEWVDELLSSDFIPTKFSTTLDTVRNIHDPSQMDTIKHFKTSKSNINMYVTPNKTMLMESDIYDSEILLSNKIKVGVKKEVVFEVLNQKFANDTIKIQEPDGYGVYFELFFKNDLLYRIYFKSFIDWCY